MSLDGAGFEVLGFGHWFHLKRKSPNSAVMQLARNRKKLERNGGMRMVVSFWFAILDTMI